MRIFLACILFGSISAFMAHGMGSKSPAPQAPVITKDHDYKAEYGVVFKAVEAYSTPAERLMVDNANKKIREVVGSKCFGDFFLKTKLVDTNGRDNEKVLAHIRSMTGEIPVKFYYRKFGSCLTCTSAKAYRMPPGLEINLNRGFFDSKVSLCEYSSTIAHEGLGHAIGNYQHGMVWSLERESSVAYRIGGSQEKYGGSAFQACCSE